MSHAFVRLALIGSLIATSACVNYPEDLGLKSADFESDLLVELTRADGSPLPNWVEFIEQNYGFRAQVMNIIVPDVAVELQSPLEETDPSRIRMSATVTGWQTIQDEVVNETKAVTFMFQLLGQQAITVDEGGCRDWIRNSGGFIDALTARVREALQTEMKLKIVGTAEGSTDPRVLELSPSLVEFHCVVDETRISGPGWDDCYWDFSNALLCSGKLRFATGS